MKIGKSLYKNCLNNLENFLKLGHLTTYVSRTHYWWRTDEDQMPTKTHTVPWVTQLTHTMVIGQSIVVVSYVVNITNGQSHAASITVWHVSMENYSIKVI